MAEPCTMSHDLGCQAFARYEVTGKTLTVGTCGTHLTRVVRSWACGNEGVVTVRVLRD
jgi:hypothetical protein